MNIHSLPEFITLHEAGKILNVHHHTLRLWDTQGILPSHRFGRKKIRGYKKNDIINFLETPSPPLARIINTVPSMIAVYNIHTGSYSFISQGIKKLLGYSPQEFKKGGVQFVSSLVHPDDLSRIMKENQHALKKANSKSYATHMDASYLAFEFRIKHRNGSYRWLHTDGSVFSRDQHGSVESVLNVSIDITNRKEIEERIKQINNNIEKQFQDRTQELLKSEERFRLLVQNSSDIITLIDREGIIKYRSPSIKTILGYPAKKQIGINIYNNNLVHPDDRKEAIRFFQKLLKRKNVNITAEFRMQHRDGSYRNIESVGRNLLEDPHINGIIINYRDITTRKELEHQKDEFIGIASHELKTPVTSIKGYTQVIQKRFAQTKDTGSALLLGKMETQINKLSTLINDLLDITKIEAGKLQFNRSTFSVDILISETAAMMQLTTDHHTIHITGKTGKHIYADHDRIGQVLMNFLSNAIKYSPHAHTIRIHPTTNRRSLQICVEDFGLGIPKQKQGRVFDRFYRVGGARYDTVPGLGLGLYISSEVIKRHKGTVWLKSTEGKGSMFCFKIPIRNKI